MKQAVCKVPAVTLLFWVIKILATTLGETAGDALSMSMDLGYLISTMIFILIFTGLVFIQIKSNSFKPYLYWATIIATTTLGTTLADFADRSLGIGYTGGSSLLLGLLITSLIIWYRSTGTLSVNEINNPRAEWYYWVTIMFSQTLGTALGDWTADTQGLGYLGAAVIFGGLLIVLAYCHFKTQLSKTFLFWSAFVLTRPLGAVVGDFLDKPLDHGGLALSRYGASLTLITMIVLLLWLYPQRAASRSH